MFNPAEVNSEFIEIVNNSETETIDISNFKILYHTSSSGDNLVSVNSEYILQPKQYAIVFEGDYDFENGIYKEIIPNTALVLTLDDNSFGSRGMANSSDRTIYLLDSNDDTLDVYTYSANNQKGISDEREITTVDNWVNSTITNGTPGSRNSIAPKENDLALVSFTAENTNVTVGNNFTFTIKIKNLGTLPSSNTTLDIYKDENFDRIPQSEELQSSEIIDEVNVNDSIKINKEFENKNVGENIFIAEIEFDLDEYPENNTKTISVYGTESIGEKDNLIINEIMFAPKSPEPEWIEIYNRSEKQVTLMDYQIADAKDTIRIVTKDVIIEPSGFIVIADDSSINQIYPSLYNYIVTNLPTLNNSGDKVILLDSHNRIIDSVYYNSNWGGKNGKSLERISSLGSSIDSSNWKVSLTSGTPGKINSVTQKDFDIKIENVFSYPQFPIINNPIRLGAKIKNIGKNFIEFKINLFADTNIDSIKDNLLETSDQLLLNPNDSLIYKFNFNDTLKLKQGYILEISQEDDDVANNIFYYSISPGYPKKSILINEIKYSPKNDEPEWVELFNNSDYDIDLKDWLIGDVLTTPVFKTIFDSEYIFPSKTFLIISKSGSIFNYYRNISAHVQELKFANLNNDRDGIVIKDNRSATIDSVMYTNKMGGKNGESLERVSLEFESNNQNNWKPSLDIEGGTPGRINSVTSKNYDLIINSISTIPIFPIKNEKIKVKIKIVNRGNFDAKNFSISFFYGKDLPNKTLEQHSNLSLLNGDSLTIMSDNEITVLDTFLISAKIEFPKDEDQTNNHIDAIVVPGFNKNSILINEVMIRPNEGNPSWIELVNNSDSTINLNGWSVGNSKNRNLIAEKDILLKPNEFLILSQFFNNNPFNTDIKIVQTNLPKLSSGKVAVIIYDFRNAVIDSIFFSFRKKLVKGISLERISLNNYSTDISNWMFSLNENGSTPGRNNSIMNILKADFGDIIINEIMFESDSTNCEFVELYNNSQNPIELGGWRIVDEKGKSFSVFDFSKKLQSKEYFVISADSTILGNYPWLENSINLSIKNISSLYLTNSDKLIYLKDFLGNIIDSLHYSKKWHNSNLEETRNISLELINYNAERNSGSNWNSCINAEGATPGKQNSIYVEKLESESKLNISPNPFSPDNDGYEDFTFINYKLTQAISQIRIKIFDSKGRLVRILANNKPSGNEGIITFDGLDKNKNPLRMGIYIVFLEALNSTNSILEVVKGVVVVARKL